MIRSMILSTTVAIAMASESSTAANSAAAPQQELWYPAFSTDYESGTCTTSPSPALLAFARGGALPESDDDMSSLAQQDKESCCETWFPEQEACGCLGACPEDENDAAPTPAAPLDDEENYWYPQFDLTYDQGKCVKVGVNTDVAAPGYYTKEGSFLHTSLDACCQQWFGHQESDSCVNVVVAATVAQQQHNVNASNENATTTTTQEVDDGAAVASVASPLSSLVVDETL